MIATLTFNLPEEQNEFDTANNALNYKRALNEISYFLRNKVKYGGELNIEVAKMREEFYKILEENGVEL